MRVTKIAILIECFVAYFINFRLPGLRKELFVAYVICNTDLWTPLSHNSTYPLIPS
jgi:hypothetical protein